MDNASKALVMAGAILIAVMLISLGVLLYTRAAGIAEDSLKNVDAIGVQAFNEQFTQFCGPSIKGTVVKTLIGKVKAAKTAGYTISIVDSAGTALTAGAIDSKKSYKVTDTTYNTTTGVISKITVQ